MAEASGRPTAARDRWIVVLVGALIAAIVTFVLIMVANEVVIPPLIIIGVIFAGLAAAVWRWPGKRWLFILTAVLVGLALLLNIPFAYEDVVHPNSFFSFFPTTLSFIAGIVAVVAAIAVAMRANDGPAWPVAGAAVVLGVVALVVSVAATLALEDDAQQEGDTLVVAEDVEYPETLTARAGNIAFFIENHDRIRHTFVIEDQDVKEEIPGSTDRRVEAELVAGEYRYYCDVPGHEDMEGTLQVQ